VRLTHARRACASGSLNADSQVRSLMPDSFSNWSRKLLPISGIKPHTYTKPHRPARSDQRNRVTTHGVPHDHNIVVTPLDGNAHHVGIRFISCRSVLDRQVHCDHTMARIPKKWS